MGRSAGHRGVGQAGVFEARQRVAVLWPWWRQRERRWPSLKPQTLTAGTINVFQIQSNSISFSSSVRNVGFISRMSNKKRRRKGNAQSQTVPSQSDACDVVLSQWQTRATRCCCRTHREAKHHGHYPSGALAWCKEETRGFDLQLPLILISSRLLKY